MTDLSLKVEVFGGTPCDSAIQQMCRLASRLGVIVSADMNGVHVMAKPFCDPLKLAIDWREAMDSDRSYKVVCGQPATLQSLGEDK